MPMLSRPIDELPSACVMSRNSIGHSSSRRCRSNTRAVAGPVSIFELARIRPQRQDVVLEALQHSEKTRGICETGAAHVLTR